MSDIMGWSRLKVKEAITHHASGPSPNCEERNVYSSEEWGLLKTTAITWNGWDSKAHKVPPSNYWYNQALEVIDGDVLITKAGPRHRVGVVVYVPKAPPKLMVSGKMILLRPDTEKTNAIVLAAVLATKEVQRFLDSRTTGMADSQLNFTNDLLLNTVIHLPSYSEQKEIARILSTVDQLIERTEGLIAKYLSIKAGLLQDLLTRGIDVNGELRPPYEEAPDLYKESTLGRIPRQWEITTIEKVIEGRPKNGYSPQESEEFTGTLMLGLGCLTFDGFKPIQLKNAPRGDAKIDAALLEEGDLLMSRSNTRDLVALVGRYKNIGIPCSYPDLMMRLRASKEILAEFLEYTLRFHPVRRQLTSAARGTSGSMVKINSDMVCNTLIPRLDIKEQKKILQVISMIKAPLDAEENNLQKLLLLKSGLMQDLLTGRVRVTPEPEDEESGHV